MSFCLSISWASQKKDTFSSGGELGKLIESQGCSFGSSDSVSGSLCEPKGCNFDSLGDIEESSIVGYGSNDGNNSAVVLSFSLSNSCTVVGQVFDDSGDGDGISVQSCLVESLVDNLVELGFGSSGEERVKLHYLIVTLIKLFK